MLAEKKISIIVPTYLEEKMLGALLKKFDENIKSKYNLEIIVSDGGSTDATVAIANQYADIVIEHHETEKQNIAQGRNNGANVATSEHLVFLNADCMPENLPLFLNFIAKWTENYSIKNKNSIDAIACKVKAFPNEENLLDKIFYLIHNNYVCFLNYLGVGMGRGECQIVKKNMFELIGKYNENLVAGEDFDLYRRIKQAKGKIYFSNELIIYESPRRFRKYGYIKTLWYWTINSLTVMFWGRSVSKEWEAVR